MQVLNHRPKNYWRYIMDKEHSYIILILLVSILLSFSTVEMIGFHFNSKTWWNYLIVIAICFGIWGYLIRLFSQFILELVVKT